MTRSIVHRATGCLGLAVLLLALPQTGTSAGTPRLAQLRDFSSHILVGRVLSITPRHGENTDHFSIVSDVVLDVSRYAKGDNVGSRVTVTTLGGQIGNRGAMVSEEAQFRVGEEVLLFLTSISETNRFRTASGYSSKHVVADGRVVETGMTVDEFLSSLMSGAPLDQSEQSPGIFSVQTDGPTVMNVIPDSAAAATDLVETISVVGSGFGGTQGSGKVNFQGQRQSPNITSWSDTLIVCEVPRPSVGTLFWLSGGCVRVRTNSGLWSGDSTGNSCNTWGPEEFSPLFNYSSIRWANSDFPVSFYINTARMACACDACDTTDIKSAIQDAFDKWGDIDSCQLAFTYAGPTADSLASPNGKSTISWICQWERFWALALSTWFYTLSGDKQIIYDVDMELNADPTPPQGISNPFTWSMSGYENYDNDVYDIQHIVTHEAGHWAGLLDIFGADWLDVLKMMGTGATGSGNVPAKRELAHGDIAGAKWIYGHGTYAAANKGLILGCPGWDGDSLIISVHAEDAAGTPLANEPASNIYAITPKYCYNNGTAYADSATNSQGNTTVSMLQLGHGCSTTDSVEIEVYLRGEKITKGLRKGPQIKFFTYDLAGNDCRITSADTVEFEERFYAPSCCIDYHHNDTCGYWEDPPPFSRIDFADKDSFYVHAGDPIRVKWPNGGESWAAGSQREISWIDSDGGRNNSYVTLLLSSNGGSSFPTTIATGEANDGSYTWTIPADAESLGTYRIRAVVYDNVGGSMNHFAADTSDANFTITWGTPICGTISSNTSWSGSIYVPCDVVVSSGAQLTVSPGTLVRFAKSDSSGSGADATKCELIVQGTLSADGTSQSKPTFSSATSSPAAGDWRGIRLRPHNTNNLLDNCVIKYAYTGIEAESTTASVDSCTISYFTNDGIKAIASAVVIRKNTIELGTSGVRGIELTSSTSGEVSGSAGTGHHNSITCSSSNTNTTYGILSSGSASADLEYTWIDGVKYGIKCSGSSGPAIAHNWIQNTKNNGIQTADDAAPSIHYTTIQGFQGTGLTAIDYSNPYLGADTDSGSNRVIPSQTYNYYVANLTEYTVMTERNWWDTSTPSSGKFYGDVDYSPVNSTDPGTSYELPLVPEPGSPPATPYAVQNYPNPFNPTTTIEYGVSAPSRHVRIAVYDLVGRVVAVLVDAPKPAGRYTAAWDGRNASGEAVASGVYFYEVKIGEFREAKKLVVLK